LIPAVHEVVREVCSGGPDCK